MILAMKIISMGFDLDTGQIPSLPGPVEYQGYCFCVGSVIFGPWTSYNSYLEVVQSSSLVRIFDKVAALFTCCDT